MFPAMIFNFENYFPAEINETFNDSSLLNNEQDWESMPECSPDEYVYKCMNTIDKSENVMSCESPSQWNGNEEKESKSWKSPLGKNKLKKKVMNH
jgi:hypothetical protein